MLQKLVRSPVQCVVDKDGKMVYTLLSGPLYLAERLPELLREL